MYGLHDCFHFASLTCKLNYAKSCGLMFFFASLASALLPFLRRGAQLLFWCHAGCFTQPRQKLFCAEALGALGPVLFEEWLSTAPRSGCTLVCFGRKRSSCNARKFGRACLVGRSPRSQVESKVLVAVLSAKLRTEGGSPKWMAIIRPDGSHHCVSSRQF